MPRQESIINVVPIVQLCYIIRMSDIFHQTDNGSESVVTDDSQIQLPPECNVIFYNDDYTTMDFVVEVLVSVFCKSAEEARDLMLYIHENGSAVIGKYTYDIAVSRTNLTRSLAKKNGFPLRVEIE